jgi:predicted phosphodiesterase
MKIAVLADIHGNLEALNAVRGDVEQFAVDRVVCLGDNIGYGPDPDEVVNVIQKEGYDSVLGNHEFALHDLRGRRWLNFQAAENNQTTEDLLSKENLQFCVDLPVFLVFDNGYFVHGFPKASVFRYLSRQNDERIVQLFRENSSSIFFVGHTHDLELVTLEDAVVIRRSLKEGTVVLDPQKKYIVNCGSVGQPRDGDNSAKYIVWDSRCGEIKVRYVPYDVNKTINKIKERGFPKVYALRLG